ncbi:multidrug resistance-associated protein 7-like isoform X2 [Pecten maximus]|uniref:multidrug resistance-associated protein 7-like isoform X2 n=1 Tax=Pecten maximus TaxID=6579 RepID=UPI001458C73E|nr:multidrug resistance-associated protein 7-like isoform X2 [Pecten maximus]
MEDDYQTVFLENKTPGLKNNGSVVSAGIFMDVTFVGIPLNITLAFISVLIVYFLTRKVIWGKQDDFNSGKKSNQQRWGQDCEDSLPLNEDDVSLFSMLTYDWVEPLLDKGSSRPSLTSKDMFTMPNSLNVKNVQEKFCKTLKTVENISKQTNKKKHNLLKGLYKAYGLDFLLLCGLLELLAHLIDFTSPITLNWLISFFENDNEPAYVGYRYVFLLFLSTFGKTLVDSRFHYVRMHVIFKTRISIMTTVYQKAMRISTVALSKFSTGEIVNFLGTDTNRILQMLSCFHTLWSLPLETIICMYILYQLVGVAFMGGLIVALGLVPINKIVSTKQITLGKVLMKQKDNRTKMINEVLGGIKTIKLYTWENHFQKMIANLRDAELYTIRQRKIISAISSFLWTLTPILMTVLTFTIYSMIGKAITAAKMFTCLALFMKLLGSLNDLPYTFNSIMQAVISLERIERFVALEDIDFNKYYEHKQESKKANTVISVNAGKFTWKEKSIETDGEPACKLVPFTLRDITVHVTEGQFIGVIGKVGSGKSSLLDAILAEMGREEGDISVSNLKSGFGLVGQEPWIQQATVRDNITFGSPFNARRYAEVLDAASLKKDILMLPAGDRTEVGEKGVTLSGGQKARLALARALYQDKDVYLLDDPLAAVDAHVAQHIYDNCIMGMLRTKTKVLCTHHAKFLGKADIVIAMDDGVISKMGLPGDVLDDIKFAEHKPTNIKDLVLDHFDNTENDGKLGEETKATGEMELRVYKSFLASLEQWLVPAMMVSFIVMQAFEKMKSWWLTHWVSSTAVDNNNISVSREFCFHDNMSSPISKGYGTTVQVTHSLTGLGYYMAVYMCLAGVYAVAMLVREFLFVYGGMSIAKTMHNDLLKSILKAPMAFFDITPVGRILNRFSSDMDVIDDPISNGIKVVLTQLFGIAAGILVACYGMPWFCLVLLPVALLYYYIQERYRHTSREVRRLASLNRSPIFSHFSETVSGVVTIRAFRETERFKDQHLHRVNNWLRTHYTSHNISIWLLLRTQIVGIVMVTGIAFLAVMQHNILGIDPGVAGLALSYTLTLSGRLYRIVTCVTEVEKQMVSVERVQQYIEDTPSEKWEGSKPISPWPAAGVISYSDVYMKYRDGLPNVLKGLMFSTRPAEKVGIVGRTGSGKSSLFQTLFRTVEISSGDITIDGVSIQQLDLKDVRRHMAVIPQDPFLFSGTVRNNLDPTSSYSDEELWGVLDRCHLRVPVDRLGGLEGEVGEKGRYFSVGQKQLMCLARALLTKAKVLCIDEATASVDLKTDQLIQETIRQEFVDSTVLTIAHRINTIMDSDRVLVMDQGQVAELDSPENLLKDQESAFYKLVHGENSNELISS